MAQKFLKRKPHKVAPTDAGNRKPGTGNGMYPPADLFKNVRAIFAKARAAVYTAANTAMVEAYWNVGREIVEKQGGESLAKYGEGLINALALRLTTEFGDGFTLPNLRNMRQFYLTFPKRYALRSEFR